MLVSLNSYQNVSSLRLHLMSKTQEEKEESGTNIDFTVGQEFYKLQSFFLVRPLCFIRTQ